MSGAFAFVGASSTVFLALPTSRTRALPTYREQQIDSAAAAEESSGSAARANLPFKPLQ